MSKKYIITFVDTNDFPTVSKLFDAKDEARAFMLIDVVSVKAALGNAEFEELLDDDKAEIYCEDDDFDCKWQINEVDVG